ncbi:MAG: nucleoside deaminase [Planctomycetes bacterium]|nr:nucleoside deaminase [Planctomycetota bacterium]
MSLAIKEAERAYEKKEIPVGAVVLFEGRVIGKGYNQVETLKDPTAHAEILAITAAASYLESKWLHEAELYVTKEPCPMCAGAIVLSRLKNLIIGAMDTKAGACGSVLNIVQHPKLNHKVQIISGIHEMQCSHILSSFFEELRRKK